MKAIIENGKVNSGIQSCFIAEYGVGIVFHNIDLADKFALSLNIGSNVAFVVPSPRTTIRAYCTCKAIRCRL